MKFALIAYDGDASNMSAVLAALAGTGMSVVSVSPNGAVVAGDDDDGGPANPAAPGVDSNGLPWDERIHSSSKALTEKGAWRKRKGVNDLTVTAVEAELRARAPNVAAALAPHIPPVTTGVPLPPPVIPGAPGVPAVPMPMPPVPPLASPGPEAIMPHAPPVPVPAASQPGKPDPETVTDFNKFMQLIAPGLQTGAYTAEYFGELCGKISVAANLNPPMTAITDLSQPSYNHLVSYAAQLMRNDGKW